MNKLDLKIVLSLIILLMASVSLIQAEPEAEITEPVYYMADDASGTQQVYQLLINGEQEARQLTHAESDVITFGVAHDGLSVAYISDGQVLLQPIHTEEVIALAEVTATQFFGEPVYSPDDNYIAYADGGIWLLELAKRESHKILTDVLLDETASNMPEYRIYQPDRFLTNDQGETTHLLVQIGIWEWQSSGVYNLATGELLELTGQIHTDFLPLSDGRVLVYGNNGVGGEASLSLANSLDELNEHQTVFEFSELTDATLFADRAVEIEASVVRIFGWAIQGMPADDSIFYFDYVIDSGEASDVHFISLPKGTIGGTVVTELSPDGEFVPMYVDALWTDNASIYGGLSLLNIETEEIVYRFDQIISIFNWQP